MVSEKLTMTVACDRHLVALDVPSQRVIEWRIQAPQQEQRQTERAPLNLALVIDRSGSMAGEKLSYVQQAACHVLDMLNAEDRVAVVAYDDQISLIAPGTYVSDAARDELKTSINALKPGGTTNLSGGWLEGCRQISEHQSRNGIHRALLLTDGLANRGITDIEELALHARELRQRGITTSTFGVGLDFNEHLLEGMASQGGGHFYYIERPGQIPEFFRNELGELLTVVARETVLRITIPQGISLETLGDIPHEQEAGAVRIFVGDLCAKEQRTLYTRLLLPPGTASATVKISGELGYANLDNQTEAVADDIVFSYGNNAEVQRSPLNEAVLQRVSEVELATASTRALQLERAGKRREAAAMMRQSLAANVAHAPAAMAAEYEQLSDRMEKGLDEQTRKAGHYAAYQKRHRS
jgi:Ca-activated chloride channel homolog